MSLLKNVELALTTRQAHFLSKEEAIAWIVYRLSQVGREYPAQLIRSLELNYYALNISDTILYAAIAALSDEDFIAFQTEKQSTGRGRPKNMYALNPTVNFDNVVRAWVSRFGEGVSNAA